MNWLTGRRFAEGKAKCLILQLSCPTNRDYSAQELVRLGADVVPALVEALHSQDLNLLSLYQQVLARIPSATATLTKIHATAHPIIRGRVAEVFQFIKIEQRYLS